MREAVAFVMACNRLKIDHAQRSRLLEESGGIKGLVACLARGREGGLGLFRLVEEELTRQRAISYPPDWKALSIHDQDYPQRLKHIGSPPSILFFAGNGLAEINGPCVIAVIGTRKPSVYGREVTRDIAAALAGRKVPVVSGGARGIDALAHRSALEKGGVTFAVLGHGLDQSYPPEHRSLFAKIREKGALITEYPPGVPPRRQHFPARNRIIAGLCDAVLVTEASLSSGTLITAGFAGDYGRDVAAVPGSILAGTSTSCHQLIREGAILFENIDDIPGVPPPMWGEEEVFSDPSPLLAGTDRLIWETLHHAPRTLGELVDTLAVERETISLRLAVLTVRGLVRINRGRYTAMPAADKRSFDRQA